MSISRTPKKCKFCKQKKDLVIYGEFCSTECVKGRNALLLEKKKKADQEKLQKYLEKNKDAIKWQQDANRDWKKFKVKAKKENRSSQAELVLTKKSFQYWIKVRDKLNGINHCISCKKIFGKDEKFDAGHFWKAENYSTVILHPDNVHSQCVYCNRELQGNLLEYQPRLKNKIGEDRYKRLNELAKLHKEFKYPRYWLKEYRAICEDMVRKNESDPQRLIEKLKELELF